MAFKKPTYYAKQRTPASPDKTTVWKNLISK